MHGQSDRLLNYENYRQFVFARLPCFIPPDTRYAFNNNSKTRINKTNEFRYRLSILCTNNFARFGNFHTLIIANPRNENGV